MTSEKKQRIRNLGSFNFGKQLRKEKQNTSSFDLECRENRKTNVFFTSQYKFKAEFLSKMKRIERSKTKFENDHNFQSDSEFNVEQFFQVKKKGIKKKKKFVIHNVCILEKKDNGQNIVHIKQITQKVKFSHSSFLQRKLHRIKVDFDQQVIKQILPEQIKKEETEIDQEDKKKEGKIETNNEQIQGTQREVPFQYFPSIIFGVPFGYGFIPL